MFEEKILSEGKMAASDPQIVMRRFYFISPL